VKSRTNFERRQRSTEARLDPSWQPERARAVLEGGNLHYEVSGRVQAISGGGLGLMQSVVEAVGLAEAIDEDLHLLRRHLPYHESDHVLALVYNILVGGRCLEDLELRRSDEGFLDALGARRLPDPTTAGDFLRRFGPGSVESLMDAADRCRARVWRAQPESDRKLALIDVDGTISETGGECKERMDITYDGRWGYGPLVVSLANSQEVLRVVNRPANRPSHEGMAACVDTCLGWALGPAGFQRARLRGDTDFSLTENFDRWTEAGVEFVFGMDANPHFIRRAEALGDEAWTPMQRPVRPVGRRRPANVKKAVIQQRGFQHLELAHEHVAEIEYRPRKCKTTYRLVILRKRIEVTRGQLRLADEIRHFFYVTNIDKAELDAAAVVRENNARCHQENLIEQLKNGVGATRMPVAEFDANWAYLVIASLAWNLKAWAALLLPAELGARTLLHMEFRRFLHEIILLPAQILRSGRRLIFRLLAINRWVPLLLDGTRELKRLCLA